MGAVGTMSRGWHFRAGAIAASFLLGACGGGSTAATEPTGPTVPAHVEEVVSAAATAMGDVTSVRFDLTRSGSRVYIDQFESIAIDRIVGEFAVPQSAQAVLDVEVNDSLKTQLAAIALADEVWLSNPITGDYETLPPGYDIDPSAFFDPKNGWQPLMENLTDPGLIGLESRDGADRYHVRGTATKEQMKIITAGLVRNQDVVIDFWIHPVTALVQSVEFTNDLGNGDINWTLELSQYGDEFSIEPPEGVNT